MAATAEVALIAKGCRGCRLCVDTCPVQVFEANAERQLAEVRRPQDCIGCLSCVYVCPSLCIAVSGVEALRPFHRSASQARLVERFLQQPAGSTALSSADLAEAKEDAAARLRALAATVLEVLGRGHRAVGRRAGALAAAHQPEIYEHPGLEGAVEGIRGRLGPAFGFAPEISGREVRVRFAPCGLCQMVTAAGETVGTAVLCELFHEYCAGLLSAYAGEPYKYQVGQAGESCAVTFSPAN
jgi:2-oxoglutarate ferredoxin oxidoreductase subunit delta